MSGVIGEHRIISIFFALAFRYSKYTFQLSYCVSLVIGVIFAEVTIKCRKALVVMMPGWQVETGTVPRDVCSPEQVLTLSKFRFITFIACVF